MRHLVLSAIAALGLLASSGTIAVAAPHAQYECPADARGTVTYSGTDTRWIATTQSSGLIGTSVETIGGQVSLVCKYRMFGGEYWLYQRPDPAFPNCRVWTESSPRLFYCLA